MSELEKLKAECSLLERLLVERVEALLSQSQVLAEKRLKEAEKIDRWNSFYQGKLWERLHQRTAEEFGSQERYNAFKREREKEFEEMEAKR